MTGYWGKPVSMANQSCESPSSLRRMTMATALNFRTLDLNLLRVFDVVMAERNHTRRRTLVDHAAGCQQCVEALEGIGG